MTPQQKLVYLKSLDDRRAALRDKALYPDDKEIVDIHRELGEIDAERVRILADVHLPPAELVNLPDPETWAHHMARTLPGLSEATAFAWLDKAMYAAGLAGKLEGRVAAAKDIDQRLTDGRQALVGAIRLVLNLQERKVLNPPMVRDPNDPDNPPVTLREYLESVLRSVGEDA